MSTLILTPNLPDADDLYEKLIALHADLSPEESLKVQARLILTLINHIGDPQVVRQAIAIARPPASVATPAAVAA